MVLQLREQACLRKCFLHAISFTVSFSCGDSKVCEVKFAIQIIFLPQPPTKGFWRLHITVMNHIIIQVITFYSIVDVVRIETQSIIEWKTFRENYS